jgi:ligand-binding sensor domain-containing protein
LGIYVYDVDLDQGGFYKGLKGPANQLIKAVSCFENEVWFGTHNGIEAFDAERKDWLPSPARRYDTKFEVNRILADEKAVWAVTDRGVLKYDRQFERWVHFTTEDGLISNHVYSLILDGDYIWFGSDKGLTRFYWNDPTRTD